LASAAFAGESGPSRTYFVILRQTVGAGAHFLESLSPLAVAAVSASQSRCNHPPFALGSQDFLCGKIISFPRTEKRLQESFVFKVFAARS
jgi:hypothetical protein